MNAPELYKAWQNQFLKSNNEQYNVHVFLGREYHFLKQLLERYSEYDLLLAIETAIKSYGITSIQQFSENIEQYIQTTKYSKYIYLVRKFGGDKEKALLQSLLFLESKWLVSAEDISHEKQTLSELDMWIEAEIEQ